MSRLIKSESADRRVRGLNLEPLPSKHDTRLRGLEAEIAALRDGLAVQAAELAAARSEADAAFERGREEGLQAGRVEGRQATAAAAEALRAGLSGLRDRLDARFEAAQGLAAALAHAALTRILGDPAQWGAMTEAVLRTQAGEVREGTVLEVLVAEADFPQAEALDRLAIELGWVPGVIRRSPSAPSGTCRLKLKLGEIEASLPAQWRRLSDLLADLAEPRSGA